MSLGRNERLRLRTLDTSDLALRVRWLNDPEVNRYLSYELPITLDGTLEWFRRVQQDPNREELTICHDGEPIGFCGFLAIDRRAKKAEHHLFIGSRAHRGRGLGQIAYRELVVWGFERLGLNRIYGYQHVDNFAAQRTTHRAGWTREGLLREDGVYHGIASDRYLISMLRSEWAGGHRESR